MQVDSPEGADWPITAELSNGRRVEADFVISAVGVTPNTQWLGDTLALEPADRGILVDWQGSFPSPPPLPCNPGKPRSFLETLPEFQASRLIRETAYSPWLGEVLLA